MSKELAEIKDKDLNEVWDRVQKSLARIYDSLTEIAGLFARMSNHQLELTKKRFKGVLTVNQIELLRLHGRGTIKRHLMLPLEHPPLTAKVLETIPQKDLDTLNDPNAEILVATAQGPRFKKVSEVSAIEMKLAVRNGQGLRTQNEIEEMCRRGKEPRFSLAKLAKLEGAETVEKILQGKTPGVLVIYGNNGSRIAVQRRMLKHWMA